MIRTLSGHHPTREQRERRQYRVVGRLVKPKSPRAARTEIILCVVCRRAYPLHGHDDLTCARKHGLNGNDLYMLERSFGHIQPPAEASRG